MAGVLEVPRSHKITAFKWIATFVNYWGSRFAVIVYNRTRTAAKFDRVVASLLRRLDRETTESLARAMPYPTRWDPFFKPLMTLADLYH